MRQDRELEQWAVSVTRQFEIELQQNRIWPCLPQLAAMFPQAYDEHAPDWSLIHEKLQSKYVHNQLALLMSLDYTIGNI